MEFTSKIKCPMCSRLYPDTAGECPYDMRLSSYNEDPIVMSQEILTANVPPLIARFVDKIAFVDNGKAPRWNHAFGYENKKIGVVNHIPVCDTLKQLTDYFNSGTAEGSVHFGNGRDLYGYVEYLNYRIPISEVHQYMPVLGMVAPWAQGVINCNTNCDIPCSPTIKNMRPGEPNGAFVSIENVARSGSQGVTDPQFNSNVLLRAWAANYFNFPVNPLTQLWHAEIDGLNRCSDPGWTGDLEDKMQDAANKVLGGDVSGLRAVEQIGSNELTEAQVKIIVQDAIDKYHKSTYTDSKGWGRMLENMLYVAGLTFTRRFDEAINKLKEMK